MGWGREEQVVLPNPEVVTVTDPDAPVKKRFRERTLPEVVSKEITHAVGGRKATRVSQALLEASKAYERERFGDALKVLRAVAEDTPDVAAVRELTGLCLYRQGKWAEAIRELQRFTEITGSVEQNPVLADCHRALRHYGVVDELWEELAAASPNAELVTEGRIVMAGSLADQGRLTDAIRLLERAPGGGRRVRDHHLRLWYALADLYERAGELPRARELFSRIMEIDGDLADVVTRVANLA